MRKTDGNNKPTTEGGSTNTNTSNNESTGTESKSTGEAGKQLEKTSESNLVDQGSPAGVIVEVSTDNKAAKKVVPAKKPDRKKTEKAKLKEKERSESEKVKDIQSLLEGVFMVASLKAGQHWQLQTEESRQIAQPLSRILDRYDLLSKASEVSDPIALIVAAATIVFPRVMITKYAADNKKTETLRSNGVMNDVKEKAAVNVDSGSDSRAIKTADQSNVAQSIKSLHTEIQG